MEAYPAEYEICARVASHRDRWELLTLTAFRQRDDVRSRDIPILVPKAKDESFHSPKGIPIVVAACTTDELPCFYDRIAALQDWMALKRDALAAIAIEHDDELDRDHLHCMGLTNKDRTFNFLYLNMVVANATYRLAETKRLAVKSDDVDQVGREILKMIIDCANDPYPELPTVKQLFDRYGSRYPYVAIDAVLKLLGPRSCSRANPSKYRYGLLHGWRVLEPTRTIASDTHGRSE